MSFYDEAAVLLIAGGGASKDSKVYNIKPMPTEVTGNNVVTNGTFNTSGSWDLGTYGSIEGGKGVVANSTAESPGDYGWGRIQQSCVVANKKYRLEVDVTLVEGSGFKIQQPGYDSSIGFGTASGHYVFYFKAINDEVVFARSSPASSYRVEFDNIEIVEIESLPVDFTMSRDDDVNSTRVKDNGQIERYVENLLQNSNELNTAPWAANNATGGQPGLYGSNTAWRLQKGTANPDVAATPGQSDYYNEFFSGLQTFSIYVKKEAGKGLAIYNFYDWFDSNDNGILDSHNGYDRAFFNLENGEVVPTGSNNPLSATIYEVSGQDWYRVSMTVDRNTSRWYLYCTDGTATLTLDAITIQYPQLEYSQGAHQHTQTYTGSSPRGLKENQPRFDYTNSTCPKLLVEMPSTNEILHSELLALPKAGQAGADHLGSAMTATMNSAFAPDGSLTATKLEKTTDNTHLSFMRTRIDGLTDVERLGAYSIFVKKGNHRYVGIRNNTNGHSVFDFDAGEFVTNIDGNRTLYADKLAYGWWRLYDVNHADPAQVSPYRGICIPNVGGSENASEVPVGAHVFAWGAQFEKGFFKSDADPNDYVNSEDTIQVPTSYIPTNGAAATRTAESGDTGEDTGSPFYNGTLIPDEFTWFVDFDDYHNGSRGLFRFVHNTIDGTNPTSVSTFVYNNHIGYEGVKPSNNQSEYIGGTFINNKAQKAALTYDKNSVRIYVDGSCRKYDTTVAPVTGLKRAKLLYSDSNKISYKALGLFPISMYNHDMEILTGADSYATFVDAVNTNEYNIHV